VPVSLTLSVTSFASICA